MKAVKYKILNFLFVITLGKFFFQWLLPSNPQSHNPVWTSLCRIIKLDYSIKFGSIEDRVKGSLAIFAVHLIIATAFFILEDMRISLGNVLGNLYPMWIQVYVGLRCYWAIKTREKNGVKLTCYQNLTLSEVV
jgi:hypothetical protein